MNAGAASENRRQSPGSSIPGEPEFLAVGKLRRPHGVRGEIQMEVITDFPERLEAGNVVFIGPDQQPLRIRSYRWHNQLLLIQFVGYEDRESAGGLRNQWVFVRTADVPPLEAGEYYHHQILGLSVLTTAGETIGVLQEIIETGANDVYLVRDEHGRELLLPAIDQVVVEINLEERRILVNLLPGLMPD